MIIGNVFLFGFQLDVTEVLDNGRFKNGIFHIIINGKISLPSRSVDYDLYNLIEGLKGSVLYYKNNPLTKDIGEKKIDSQDFNYKKDGPENLMFLDTGGQLSQDGVVLYLGYSANEERLIYSIDYEHSWSEVKFPRGTIIQAIEELPEFENL